MRIRCNVQKKNPLEVCFFLTETSRLIGSFIFVRINLKHSVKVEKIFAVSSTVYLFSMGFLEAKKVTSVTAKPVKVFDRLLV